MSKNKNNKIRVRFIGKNSDDVTGSMTLIETQTHKILLECGLYQSNNIKEDYLINSRKLEFKPSEIDYIFIGHGHIDHIGLLPRLYANGCKATIIAPKGTAELFTVMGADSAYIIGKDVETLQRKYGISAQPLYTADDVATCLEYFKEYKLEETVKLDDAVSFNFIPSGHIINSAQTELWITENNRTTKILYTSDMGNISVDKYYVDKFKPIQKANLVIGECTYSEELRSTKPKDREKDLEKIRSVIDTVCVQNKHRVLIPIFSLDRAQNILTHLFDLFGHDENFNIPILIDSPLTIKITNLYSTLLNGDQLDKYNEVMNWSNIKFVQEYEDSKSWMGKKEPAIILSASGFMTAGRSRQWAKTLLPDYLSHILFVGFSSEGSMASKIKSGKKQKTITIDGKPIANRCGITELHSFSGHMQFNDLLKYYSDIECEKVALVHGNFNSKCDFAKVLQIEISKKNKNSKVVIVNKTTELLI